ncbi:MAG TPA: sigma factor-like helix-turn-helix DNA-binding protein [Candidatus Paceibacterota bacterium]
MTTIKETINFKPKQISKVLLTALPERARDIMCRRYGLESEDGETLEAIGRRYGITRERVRQIEEFSLRAIRKSPVFSETQDVFAELKLALHTYGGIAHEREFLNYLDKNQLAQNSLHFLLVLGDEFTRLKEDDHFHHRWTIDSTLANRVHESLQQVAGALSDTDLLSEREIISRLLTSIKASAGDGGAEEKARRWLLISKRLGMSPVGEWGLSSSPSVRVRGVRDYAFLVLRKQGSPMHFLEVAKSIESLFDRQANPATCHNELIKDPRFVLVGRGIYALTDWGYSRGIVREVIENIIKERGPLTEEEILDRVMKERYVKHNTILVNLKNPKFFKKDKQGRYLVSQ